MYTLVPKHTPPPPHTPRSFVLSFPAISLLGIFFFFFDEKSAGDNISNCNSSPVLCAGCVHTHDFFFTFTSLSALPSQSCSRQDARKCPSPPGAETRGLSLPGGRHYFTERKHRVSQHHPLPPLPQQGQRSGLWT